MIHRNIWLQAILAQLLITFVICPAYAAKSPSAPQWTSPTSISTDTGEFTLEWQVSKKTAVELFRVTETHNGQESHAYFEEKSIDVYRVEPGQYQYALQACQKNAEGIPECGPQTKPVTVTW